MSNLSIIIPIYNEENSIVDTISQIKKVLSKTNINYEIICVNDGSSDQSGNILKTINNIVIVNHKLNKGYGASLKSGLKKSVYNTICITDADGTYPNDKIPDLFYNYKENNFDMVVGARIGKNASYPFIKKIPKFFIIKLANYITNSKIPDINSGLRVFNKEKAMDFFHLYPNGFSFTTTITTGMLSKEYEVDFMAIDYYTREGKSKIRPIKDTIGFFKLLLSIALYFNPFKFFKPIIWLFLLISIYFLVRDIFYLKDLTQGSVFFPIVTLIFFSLGLMSDLIIKRTK